jgi:hypothetical protein
MNRAVPLVLLVASACIPNEGPMMAPFQDCLRCHSSRGEARTWTAAGTWSKGASVTVVDQQGKTVSLTGNQAGNFYTAEALVFPLVVSVNGARMPDPITYGGCNVCHHAGTVTVGPLMAPGEPCLTCHGPGGMATAKFSAAGTFAPNVPVTVAGYATTTNAAGNFYLLTSAAPISWATTKSATVNGQTMSSAPSGDCNFCHGRGGSAGGGD